MGWQSRELLVRVSRVRIHDSPPNEFELRAAHSPKAALALCPGPRLLVAGRNIARMPENLFRRIPPVVMYHKEEPTGGLV